jgi:hypothetical protein
MALKWLFWGLWMGTQSIKHQLILIQRCSLSLWGGDAVSSNLLICRWYIKKAIMYNKFWLFLTELVGYNGWTMWWHLIDSSHYTFQYLWVRKKNKKLAHYFGSGRYQCWLGTKLLSRTNPIFSLFSCKELIRHQSGWYPRPYPNFKGCNLKYLVHKVSLIFFNSNFDTQVGYVNNP